MDSKPLWKSKTFWSDVLTIVVAGLTVSDHYFGTHLTDNNTVSGILGVLGVLGIYGRKTADTKIDSFI